MTSPASPFMRIGGAPTVRRVVDRLYAWILHDDVLYLTYFAKVDMPRLKAHMVKLLSSVLGGPADYQGRSLADAHAGLTDANGSPVQVTSEHYARVGDYVIAALLVEHAPPDIIDAVQKVLAEVKAEIVPAGL